VNDLHITTLYKLHNKVASRACRARRVELVELVMSSVSGRAVRQVRHIQMHGLERVESCRDMTS